MNACLKSTIQECVKTRILELIYIQDNLGFNNYTKYVKKKSRLYVIVLILGTM